VGALDRGWNQRGSGESKQRNKHAMANQRQVASLKERTATMEGTLLDVGKARELNCDGQRTAGTRRGKDSGKDN